ncbi:MAG: hypothetical protein ACJAWV_000918 [Flammeovirgaceae bacterium]|jgi:hypothetical protein
MQYENCFFVGFRELFIDEKKPAFSKLASKALGVKQAGWMSPILGKGLAI